MDIPGGLWTLGSVVLGGGIAATTQLITAGRVQRGNRDARLWDKRAEIYLELIETMHGYSYRWEDALWCDAKAEALSAHLDELIRFEPKLRAFGSSEAGEAYRLHLRSLSGLVMGADNVRSLLRQRRKPDFPWIDLDDADAPSMVGAMAEGQDEAKELADAAIREMRRDLGGRHPSASERRLTSPARRAETVRTGKG